MREITNNVLFLLNDKINVDNKVLFKDIIQLIPISH